MKHDQVHLSYRSLRTPRAAAMVVGTMNFSEDPNVLVMIIVYSLITMVLMTPLAGELGKRAKAKSVARKPRNSQRTARSF